MVNIRTKFEAVVLIGCLITLCFYGIGMATRTITDTSDTMYGQIIAGQNFNTTSFANLQSLAYSLNSTGGVLQLPSCNISMTGTLYLANNTELRGASKNSSILYLAASTNCNMIVLQGRHNIQIKNICFDMNNVSQVGPNHNYSIIDIKGTSTRKSNNITISDCTFRRGRYKALIDCEENTQYITIEHCNFIKRQYYVNGNNFGYGGAIWFSGDHCKALYNYIKDTCATGIVMEAATGAIPSKNHLIEGNTIVGYIANGIHMEGAGKSENCTIINNIVGPINSSAYLVDEGFYSMGILVTRGSTVSNNRIYNISDIGINILGNSTVTDNWIYDINGGSAYASSGSAIVVGGSLSNKDYSILTGNEINDTDNTGIVVNTNASISDCHIRGVTGANNRGIEVLGIGSLVHIRNCRIENIVSSGIHVEAVRARAIISDCTITDVGSRGIYIVKSVGGIIQGNLIEKTTSVGIELLVDASRYTIDFI